MVTRKILQAEPKNTAGRTIASRLVDASTSYAAALMNNTQQQRHLDQPKIASGDQQQRNHSVGNAEGNRALNSPLHKDTEVRNASLSSGQSVQAKSVTNSSLNDMFKVADIVQQIVTELNGAVTEEHNIVAITRIVLNQ